MADLLGGGEADNVAITDQRADEARMGFPLATKGAGELRSMLRVLGIPDTGGLFTSYSFDELRRLAALGWCRDISCPEYLSSSSTADRLANKVRGDGD